MIKVATCPLKLILFGEHSVLSGGRCIALCIKKYCDLFLPENIKKEYFLNILIQDKSGSKFILKMDKQIKVDNLNNPHNGIININYHLGCGLGSSAAISILSSVAFHKKQTIDFYASQDCIFKKANLIEDFFHGKSSGVDCATIEHGGMISFRNREVSKMSMESILDYKILIYNSCIPKDTKKCIQQVLNNKEKNYKKLSEISDQAFDILTGHFKLCDLYELIKKAQDVLEDLGVVPDKIKQEVRNLRKLGIEAKITGGGNGGHLYTFVEKNVYIPGWEEVEIDNLGFRFE